MKFYIIQPSGTLEGVYSLLTEDGEFLTSHFCSSPSFARDDLEGRRPERKKEWKKRFGDYEVLFAGADNALVRELVRKNIKRDNMTQTNDEIKKIVNKYLPPEKYWDISWEAEVGGYERVESEYLLIEAITEMVEGELRKPIKTLLCIEGIVSSDFAEDMEIKLVGKKKFTQEEAKKMQRLIGDIYHLSHNIVSTCCRNTHDDLLEKIYKGLIDSNYMSADSLKQYLLERKKK